MAYATLEQVKDQLGITGTGQDNDLQTALDASETTITRWMRRGEIVVVDPNVDPATQRIYDGEGWRLVVDDILDVDTVETRTLPSSPWVAVDTSDLELRPFNNRDKGLPYTEIRLHRFLTGQVRVTGWFGWDAIPDDLIEATILQASRLHERKGAALGVQTVVSTEGTGMRLLSKLDPDVELLLQPLRRDPVLI